MVGIRFLFRCKNCRGSVLNFCVMVKVKEMVEALGFLSVNCRGHKRVLVRVSYRAWWRFKTIKGMG